MGGGRKRLKKRKGKDRMGKEMWKEGRKEGNVERGKDLKERRRHGKRDRV